MLEFVRRNRVLLSSGFFLFCLAARCSSANAAHPRPRSIRSARLFLEVMAPFQRVASRWVGRASRGVWRRLRRPGRRRSARTSSCADRVREPRAASRRVSRARAREPAPAASCSTLQRAAADDGGRGARSIGRDAAAWFQTPHHRPGRARRRRAGHGRAVAARASSGRSSDASPHAARVLLLTDHNSGVDALVQRSARAASWRARSSRAAAQVREARRGRRRSATASSPPGSTASSRRAS